MRWTRIHTKTPCQAGSWRQICWWRRRGALPVERRGLYAVPRGGTSPSPPGGGQSPLRGSSVQAHENPSCVRTPKHGARTRRQRRRGTASPARWPACWKSARWTAASSRRFECALGRVEEEKGDAQMEVWRKMKPGGGLYSQSRGRWNQAPVTDATAARRVSNWDEASCPSVFSLEQRVTDAILDAWTNDSIDHVCACRGKSDGIEHACRGIRDGAACIATESSGRDGSEAAGNGTLNLRACLVAGLRSSHA